MAGVSAVLQEGLRRGLVWRLEELGFGRAKIRRVVERAVSDVHYVDRAVPAVARAVVGSYVEALTWTHGAYIFFLGSDIEDW